jgi:hypothetical protein
MVESGRTALGRLTASVIAPTVCIDEIHARPGDSNVEESAQCMTLLRSHEIAID